MERQGVTRARDVTNLVIGHLNYLFIDNEQLIVHTEHTCTDC